MRKVEKEAKVKKKWFPNL